MIRQPHLIEKTPIETFPYAVNYRAELVKLGAGVTIASGVVTARLGSVDETGNVLASGTPIVIGPKLQLKVKAGVDAKVYQIQLDATMSDGTVLSDQIEMTIIPSWKP